MGRKRTTAKNGRRLSRVSSRLLSKLLRQKRASVEEKKDGIVMYPRTVELAPSQGDESNKLLFALALGLRPNLNTPALKLPLVRIGRLNSKELEEARIRTKKAIFKLFEQRREARRIQSQNSVGNPPSWNPEVVDLVSSDEDSEDEPVITLEIRNPLPPSNIYSPRDNGHSQVRQLHPVPEPSNAVKNPTTLCSRRRHPLLRIQGNRPFCGLSCKLSVHAAKVPDPIDPNSTQVSSKTARSTPGAQNIEVKGLSREFTTGSNSRKQPEPDGTIVITID